MSEEILETTFDPSAIEQFLDQNEIPLEREVAFFSNSTEIPGDRHIVIFDGKCDWCQKLVRSACSYDDEGRFIFVRNDHPGLLVFKEGISVDDYKNNPYLLCSDGRVFKGAEAMVQVVEELRVKMPFLLRTFLSKALIEQVYAVMRKKWADCVKDTCDLQQGGN